MMPAAALVVLLAGLAVGVAEQGTSHTSGTPGTHPLPPTARPPGGGGGGGGARAFYTLFAPMLDSPDWPSAYEEYRGGVVVMQPFNVTRATVDAVRAALDVRVLMYFDSTELMKTMSAECAPGAAPRDCNPAGRERWTRPSSGAIACCFSKQCDAFNTTTCPPDPYSRALARAIDNRWAIRRLPAEAAPPIPICWYGFGPVHAHSAASVAGLVPFVSGWTKGAGFDGVYLDEYFSQSPGDKYLGGYPAGTQFDADGDGQPDSLAEISAQNARFRSAFTAGLRVELSPDAILIANTAGGIADPSLNGLAIEDGEGSPDKLVAWFEAQAAVAHPPQLGVVWLKSGSPAECASAATLRERFPWLLEGTDFYDGGHVICNRTAATAVGSLAETVVVYSQPTAAIPVKGRLFANPTPWPRPFVPSDATCSVVWQRGHPDSEIVTPAIGVNVSHWTGLNTTAEQQGMVCHPSLGGTPWAVLQFGDNGEWGAAFNSTGDGESLTTYTLEASIGRHNWISAGSVQVELELDVPFAFKACPPDQSDHCAVYGSLSVYFSTISSILPPRFIWYSTDLFDLGRDVTNDHVFIDTSSQKLIVSSHVSPSGQSAYHSVLPGSAASSNVTWGGGPRRFGWEILPQHLEQGIADGLARYPAHFPNGLPDKADQWVLSGFNMELEGTPNVGAGLNMRRLNISIAPPVVVKTTMKSTRPHYP